MCRLQPFSLFHSTDKIRWGAYIKDLQSALGMGNNSLDSNLLSTGKSSLTFGPISFFQMFFELGDNLGFLFGSSGPINHE